MPLFMTKGRYTDAAMTSLISSPEDRTGGYSTLVRRLEGELLDLFLVMGETDLVILARFPDNEAALAFASLIAAEGELRDITTCPLFSMRDSVAMLARAGEVRRVNPRCA